ncbi:MULTISPECIES: ABC transporter permease [unclassified Acidisoma]|uniref:ABC transporter permease n=1 Tax=unclassified Acidisoma TaxID=2634065 RepID=UPI0020B13302|nr:MULTISPECIES: ABC transporter permease [unclassified Acidisoma]
MSTTTQSSGRLRRRTEGDNALGAWLLAGPMAIVLTIFLVVPIAMLIVVSFLDYNSVQILWSFVLQNYQDALTSVVTWKTFGVTIEYAVITWVIAVSLGFWIAYFLAFEVRSTTWQMALFLLCSVPFLTSNIIRTISWIPALGRNGIVNTLLLHLHVIHQPLTFLLYSKFAIILAFVHLDTLFMITPIFNSMMRIDRTLIEAARDNGAGFWRTILNVILPLSKSGIGIGTIFVITLVMGDFVSVSIMGGGQSASVGIMIQNEISLLQYPAAAANSVILLAIVLLMVFLILRVIDIRKEL